MSHEGYIEEWYGLPEGPLVRQTQIAGMKPAKVKVIPLASIMRDREEARKKAADGAEEKP